MPKPFFFSLCADDYAMTPGVSRGILEALDADALTAVSAMTTSPWWPDGAVALGRHLGRADIGLHLNLTSGAPLGPMPLFAPYGRFPGLGTLMDPSRRTALPLMEIAEEIDRQLDRFVDVLGQHPDHVDGHQHVHVIAIIRPLVFDALDRRGWRPRMRDSSDRLLPVLGRGVSLGKAIGLNVLARGFAAQAKRRGFQVNEGFSGFSSFDVSKSYGDLFARFLKYSGRRHLVMCHPGYADDALRELDPVVESREQELAFLLSPDFKAAMLRNGATLVRMGGAGQP